MYRETSGGECLAMNRDTSGGEGPEMYKQWLREYKETPGCG
jgi:hypothetical protein